MSKWTDKELERKATKEFQDDFKRFIKRTGFEGDREARINKYKEYCGEIGLRAFRKQEIKEELQKIGDLLSKAMGINGKWTTVKIAQKRLDEVIKRYE